MSDPKRVTFETISSGSSKSLASDGASTKDEQAVRLELKLFEPNADSFPQFNFKKLCRAEKEKQKIIPLPNGFVDPIGEVDHDAVELAQEFERKYGNTYGGSDNRTAKGAVPLADKGSGYDENNGFIDDSEAYDELVPDEMDTDRGGFYINSGHLQFKQLQNKAPKRALPLESSGDESDMSEASGTLENGNVNKKPKLHDKDKIVSASKDKKLDLVKSKEKPPLAIGVIEPPKDISNKEVKTTTVKDMLRAQRDANILKSSSHINKGSKSTSSATSDDSSSSDSDSSESSSDANPSRNSDEDEFENVNDKVPENMAIDNASNPNMLNKIQMNGTTSSDNIPLDAEVKLLDNLSANMRDLINGLVENAKNLKENLFQSDSALDLLYEITKAHQSDSKTQGQIYSYLEKVLPYSKSQLMNEVKEYAIRKCENDVRTQERNLQKEINQIMPSLMEKYDIELKRIEEQRAAIPGTDKPEHVLRNPRRKFQWTENLRLSVNKLITKWQSLYAQKQIRDQTLEQYTAAYITDKLIPMWPLNWMRSNDILSHFLPKAKDKEAKKLTSEPKTSKLPHPTSNLPTPTDSFKDNTEKLAEKRKSHIMKESSKFMKTINDKPTQPKTDKKHLHLHNSSDRPTPAPLQSMPMSDAFNPKSATVKPMDAMMSNTSTSSSTRMKSITSNSSSNGSAPNFSRHTTENNLSIEYVSPTKKASDHSISQLISYAPPNHSAIAATLMQPTQFTLPPLSFADNPTTSQHSLLNKNMPGSSLKTKSDSHHRPQASSNGSINNNFLHNNNNSKQTASRLKDSAPIIDLSGDTDDGEVAAKKPKQHKHKHNKKSKESLGSSVVVPPNPVQSMLNQMHQTASMSLNPSACDEVDHNKIIHDLKKK